MLGLRDSVASSFDDYLFQLYRVHLARAKDHLIHGDLNEMQQEIDAARKFLPSEPELLTEFVPKLVKAGASNLARQLVDEFRQTTNANLTLFPNSKVLQELLKVVEEVAQTLE